MSGCQTCGGYGMHHDPIAHDEEMRATGGYVGSAEMPELTTCMNGWQFRAELANAMAAAHEDLARHMQTQAATHWNKAEEWRDQATDLYLDQPEDFATWELSRLGEESEA